MARARPIFRGLVRGCLAAVVIGACRPAEHELFTQVPLERSVPTRSAAAGAAAAPESPRSAGSSARRAGAGGEVGAGAGAAPVAGGAGRAGSVPLGDPPPDGKVHFDWTETAPNRGPCGPAMFTGRFSCEVTSNLLLVPLYTHVEGSLQFKIGGSSEAQMLSLASGELRATDNTAREFLVAPVEGAGLDCKTRVLDADVPATLTSVLPLDRQLFWGLLVFQANTTGWLRGNLDPRGLVINGDISLALDEQNYCIGTFTVTADP
jgi:hypothetical protein